MTAPAAKGGEHPTAASARRVAAALAVWLLPSLVCFWVYRLGLVTWFQQDDFAWLGLPLEYHKASDLWRVLFAPAAQGTIRPLSERAFFLIFTTVFGLDALPFRIWVFLTQFANLLLVSSIVLKLTRSRVAAAAAPILWLVNSGLMVPMSWSSSYNQILCGFFLLAAFRMFLKLIETGQRKYYIWQWVLFLLGFGALEVMVVYPGIALLFSILCARRFVRWELPLVLPSIVFTVVHRISAQSAASGPYLIQVDGRLPATLWTYWTWVLGPDRLGIVKHVPAWFGPLGTVLLTLAAFGFVAYQLYKKEYVPAFFLMLFLILITPVLPLPDHISDYYLTLPSLGVAMLGGAALGAGVRALRERPGGWSWAGLVLAVACCLLYGYTQLPVVRTGVRWRYDRGIESQALVEGVAEAHKRHPDKLILLAGVNTDLFWGAVYDNPFQLFGISKVYLVPGSEANIRFDRSYGALSSFILPARAARRALEREEAVVYSAAEIPIRNVTTIFTRSIALQWPTGLASRVDVGQNQVFGQLGEGWYGADISHRWMGRKALIRLGTGETPARSVYVTGYCSRFQTQDGPLKVSVQANGRKLGTQDLDVKDDTFELTYALPAELGSEQTLEIELEVDRTCRPPGESRDLGLAVTAVGLR